MSGVRIGEVTHFFDKISVAVLSLTNSLRVGDVVHILGRSTDFQQEVTSLHVEHQPVIEAGPGQDVALKVIQRVRPGDAIFKVSADG